MKQSNDKKRILQNSILVTAATVFEKVAFIIISIAVARYISVAEYGEYTTALGYATFFSVFSGVGIYQSLIREVNLDPENEKLHFGNSILLRTLLSFTAYILLIISLYFTNYNSDTITLILIFGIVRFGNQFLVGFYSLYDAKEKFLITSLYIIVFSLSFLSITIAVIVLKGNYFHFAYTRMATVIVFILVIYTMTYLKFKFTFDIKRLKDLILNTIPFSLQIVFNNTIIRINIIILSLIHGTIYSGIFNNGYIFLASLTFIPQNIQRVLVPYLYKENYSKNADKFQFSYDIFSKFLGIISFYIFLIFFLFSENIILTIFGEKYFDTIKILKILSFAIPFIFNAASIIITSLDRQKDNTRITGFAAIVNVVMNIVLIKFFKTEGAAMTTVLTYLIIFLGTHLFLKTKGYINLTKTIMNYIKVIITTSICCLAQYLYFSSFNWIIAIIAVSILYTIMILIILIRKEDLRIIKEILS